MATSLNNTQDVASHALSPVELEEMSKPTTPRASTEVLAVGNTKSDVTDERPPKVFALIFVLTTIGFLSSASNGLLTVGLPRIASDLKLPQHLLYWPASVYPLACGSTLLLAGSIADVVGSRNVNLTGCFLIGCFAILCGIVHDGIELILFRAIQGIAASLCFPTSVSIIAKAVPAGRTRNIGFSCLGLGQPLGFSVGLVLGGILIDTIGWRAGFYMCGAATLLLFLAGVWVLPRDNLNFEIPIMKRLATEVDWVGAVMISTSLALFSYVLAMLSASIHNINKPTNIVLLTLSLALVPTFIFWMNRQEKANRPTMIPNSLWKDKTFTSICLMILLSYAVLQTMELFSNLFFQQVQDLSPLQASIRILPSLIFGAALNFATGAYVHRVPAITLVLVTSILNAGAPLLMALINPRWPYWYDAFFAQLLQPLSADVLFTVGLLIVSDIFPARTQALAGAVFNTVGQLGNSIGLTAMAVISSTTTENWAASHVPGHMGTGADEAAEDTIATSPAALLVGYRASFWAAFAWMLVACGIGAWGLRKAGRVGLKRE